MSYVGVQPVPRATRVRTFGALAAATNTIAIPGGFSPSNIEVFIDGLYVQPTDYNDLDGFNLVFITTLALGTEYVVMEARNFEVANHYTKQEIQDASFDFNTMPTVGGDPVVESGSNADGEWTRWADGTQLMQNIHTPTSTFGTKTFQNTSVSNPSSIQCTVYELDGSGATTVRLEGARNTTSIDYRTFYTTSQIQADRLFFVIWSRWK
jgi:hypothetical protein